MKESVSSAFLFNIVVLFILLFTGIMSLTINRTRAYTVKDNIINAIERSDGNLDLTIPLGSNSDIVNAMADDSYRATGNCEEFNSQDSDNTYSEFDRDNTYSGFDRDGKGPLTFNNENSSICIKKINSGINNGCYYNIILFYKLDLPILRNVFEFSVTGETKVLPGCGDNS